MTLPHHAHQRLTLSVGLALLLASCASSPRPQAAAPSAAVEAQGVEVAEGDYRLQAVNSQKCLNVASANQGEWLRQQPCADSASQTFRLSKVLLNGAPYYRLKTQANTLCVDVRGVRTADGEHLQQWGCQADPTILKNQLFELKLAASGSYALVAGHSGKCVDVPGASTLSGTSIIQWTCNGGTNQRFTLLPVGSVTPPPPPPPPATDFQTRVLQLSNQARAQGRTCADPKTADNPQPKSGYFPAVPALAWNDQLAQSAQGHATDMATKNYFSHNSLDGRTPWDRIKAAGYTSFTALSENIAAGQSTPEDVVNSWLSDYGHCANIMSSAFKELGVGYAYNQSSTYRHYWVQDFGAR